MSIACNGYYRLRGSSKMQCNDGTWYGSLPTCEGNHFLFVNNDRLLIWFCLSEAPCSSLTAPANGAVDYSDVDGVNGYHQDGAAATFSCRGDFVINGCGVSTCVDGYWTNSVPQCYSKRHLHYNRIPDKKNSHANLNAIGPCGNVTVTTNAAVQYSATTATNLHPHGSLLVPSCGGSSQLASTEKMMCYNGNWIGSLPTCLCNTHRFISMLHLMI